MPVFIEKIKDYDVVVAVWVLGMMKAGIKK